MHPLVDPAAFGSLRMITGSLRSRATRPCMWTSHRCWANRALLGQVPRAGRQDKPPSWAHSTTCRATVGSWMSSGTGTGEAAHRMGQLWSHGSRFLVTV